MSARLQDFIEEHIPNIESHMYGLVKEVAGPQALKDSMIYSLEAGGKRIRPLFVAAVCHTFNQPRQAMYTVGATVEIIHTYSLIHDDLPCMDNDDLRRGKPTNHKVFGEALAVLAGDALNSLSFGILARMEDVSSEQRLELIRMLSEGAGSEGMVGGQVLDMEGETRQLNLEELENVHINKTGALLRFSIESGAVLSNATKDDREALAEYAHHMGLAFQIQDDILDIEGTSEQLGKTAGKDVASDKSTYPALLTIEGAKSKLEDHYQAAVDALKRLSVDSALLQEFATYIVRRNK
ncbi:polyprenyl synthetase family protein [Lysinibacillus odysseyi]|uniref:Farnesyl diphosphate synthase n=1 Tax=Lysinibacillus odysseyi 34hs-1 = NBRC 100172 TaxID=1220589 RepID=A0A0A3IA25_9BACI|nr:farnesyl diphosphate synthase [Lysinibacillus odysseyi]KGR81621.1 farnesyl-diphosphate synthase [Lysinibacillus odysseyi 34hs-1 = NBRC 100172]